jgi:hypothetical protein
VGVNQYPRIISGDIIKSNQEYIMASQIRVTRAVSGCEVLSLDIREEFRDGYNNWTIDAPYNLPRGSVRGTTNDIPGFIIQVATTVNEHRL